MTPLIINNILTTYLINQDGLIYNTKTNKYVYGSVKKTGYRMVKLTINGKKGDYAVHRLVAQTFLPNPKNKTQVNHIDRNKTNNNVNNLEWVSGSENMQHVFRTGRKKRQIIQNIDEEILESSNWKQYLNTNYWVSKDGRCANIKTGKFVNVNIANDGYGRFYLYINQQRIVKLAHRLVYEVFYDTVLLPSEDINHIDGNKLNNTLTNLEKISRRDNMLHSCYILKQNVKTIEQYDKNWQLINVYPSLSAAARSLQIDVGGISQAIHGKIKTYKGYYWKIKQ